MLGRNSVVVLGENRFCDFRRSRGQNIANERLRCKMRLCEAVRAEAGTSLGFTGAQSIQEEKGSFVAKTDKGVSVIQHT